LRFHWQYCQLKPSDNAHGRIVGIALQNGAKQSSRLWQLSF